jgi:hypothetical protein
MFSVAGLLVQGAEAGEQGGGVSDDQHPSLGTYSTDCPVTKRELALSCQEPELTL